MPLPFNCPRAKGTRVFRSSVPGSIQFLPPHLPSFIFHLLFHSGSFLSVCTRDFLTICIPFTDEQRVTRLVGSLPVRLHVCRSTLKKHSDCVLSLCNEFNQLITFANSTPLLINSQIPRDEKSPTIVHATLLPYCERKAIGKTGWRFPSDIEMQIFYDPIEIPNQIAER